MSSLASMSFYTCTAIGIHIYWYLLTSLTYYLVHTLKNPLFMSSHKYIVFSFKSWKKFSLHVLAFILMVVQPGAQKNTELMFLVFTCKYKGARAPPTGSWKSDFPPWIAHGLSGVHGFPYARVWLVATISSVLAYVSRSNYHGIRVTPTSGRINLHLILPNSSRESPHAFVLDLLLGLKNFWLLIYVCVRLHFLMS